MPDETELTLEEREKISLEQEAKQREGTTGFEVANPAIDVATDPRAARRAELQRQLDDLNKVEVPPSELSDQDLHIAFHDALIALLGSHPHLDALWQEMRRRITKS